jgi:UDP:flavonoid glycosyltransferase YjiC (YdhE family)
MMRGRFHVVTRSGGGNTTPTYALARRLIARGHEVTILGQMAQAETVRATWSCVRWPSRHLSIAGC